MQRLLQIFACVYFLWLCMYEHILQKDWRQLEQGVRTKDRHGKQTRQGTTLLSTNSLGQAPVYTELRLYIPLAVYCLVWSYSNTTLMAAAHLAMFLEEQSNFDSRLRWLPLRRTNNPLFHSKLLGYNFICGYNFFVLFYKILVFRCRYKLLYLIDYILALYKFFWGGRSPIFLVLQSGMSLGVIFQAQTLAQN